jgi:hypothetical protein
MFLFLSHVIALPRYPEEATFFEFPVLDSLTKRAVRHIIPTPVALFAMGVGITCRYLSPLPPRGQPPGTTDERDSSLGTDLMIEITNH